MSLGKEGSRRKRLGVGKSDGRERSKCERVERVRL